jgi:hypothetical protein
MFARIGYTWRIMGASFEVLKQDKQLLLFPILSSISCLLVLLSFALPLWLTRAWEAPSGARPLYYGVMFLFYFVNYFVITFFNAAVVASATMRLSGGEPTFGDGLRAAMSRLPQILGWALLAATVGMVLRIIEERSERFGRFIASLLGSVWSLVTFLVVPVIVMEQKGPLEAMKKSTSLLRKTWGEQLVSAMSFGVIFFFLTLPGVALAILGFVFGPTFGIVGLCLAIVYWIALGLVHSTLQTIFEAALYVYAEKGTAPAIFGNELLAGALASR